MAECWRSVHQFFCLGQWNRKNCVLQQEPYIISISMLRQTNKLWYHNNTIIVDWHKSRRSTDPAMILLSSSWSLKGVPSCLGNVPLLAIKGIFVTILLVCLWFDTEILWMLLVFVSTLSTLIRGLFVPPVYVYQYYFEVHLHQHQLYACRVTNSPSSVPSNLPDIIYDNSSSLSSESSL